MFHLTHILTRVSLGFFHRVLKRKARYTESDYGALLKHEGLDSKIVAEHARRYMWVSVLLYVLATAIVACLMMPLWPKLMYAYLGATGRDGERIILPHRVNLGLASVWVSAAICLFIAYLIESHFFSLKTYDGSRNQTAFNAFLSSKLGFDGSRYFNIIAFVLGVLYLLVAAALLDCYVRLTGDKIAVNGFLSVTERWCPYVDIVGLYQIDKYRAPVGTVVDKKRYLLVCRDGWRWDSQWAPDPSFATMTPLFQSLAERTGLAIEHRIGPDVP